MKVKIEEIKVNPGRREATPEAVQELADSMKQVGLLNPITLTADHTLVAGLHRLEAAKLLGWAEIECNVTDLEGLPAELAEIDENFIRTNMTPFELSKLLKERKTIYETLHPEAKAGVAQAAAMNKAKGNNVSCKMQTTTKSFLEDTAELLGVHPSTVARQLQIAENLTREAGEIIENAGGKFTKRELLRLCKLKPEQQKEAATLIASGEIKGIDEYEAARAIEQEVHDELSYAEDIVMLLSDFSKSARKIRNELEKYRSKLYEDAMAYMLDEQVLALQKQIDSIYDSVGDFVGLVSDKLTAPQS